jgi:hypothetical protein
VPVWVVRCLAMPGGESVGKTADRTAHTPHTPAAGA